jgi:hypothetical protein
MGEARQASGDRSNFAPPAYSTSAGERRGSAVRTSTAEAEMRRRVRGRAEAERGPEGGGGGGGGEEVGGSHGEGDEGAEGGSSGCRSDGRDNAPRKRVCFAAAAPRSARVLVESRARSRTGSNLHGFDGLLCLVCHLS